MPLDVMAVLPATGGGPPGHPVPSEAGGSTGAATQFASLLAQQPQAVPTPKPKAVQTAPNTASKQDDADPTDPQEDATQGSSDSASSCSTGSDWTTLAALQIPQPVLTQTTLPVASPSVSGATTAKNEVMDTAPLSAPAVPAQVDAAASGLLPLPTAPAVSSFALPAVNASAPQPTAADPKSVALTQTAATVKAVASTVTPASAPQSLAALSAPNTTAVPAEAVATVVAGTSVSLPAPVPSQTPDTTQTPLLLSAPTAALMETVTAVPPSRSSQPDVTLADPTPTPSGGTSPVPVPTPAIAVETVPEAVEKSDVPDARAAVMMTPAAASPVLSSPAHLTPAGDPILPATLTQIALQNATAPANNTGRTQTPPGATLLSTDEAVPGTVQGVPSANGTTTPTSTPVTSANGTAVAANPAMPTRPHSAAKVAATAGSAAQPELNAAKPGQAAVTDATTEGVGQDDAADDHTPADQNTDGRNTGGQWQESIGSTTPMPLPAAASLTGTQAAIPAVTDKPLTGAERAQVVRQTADGIGTMTPAVTAAGQSRMTLQLHPKEWGDLRVTVQMTPTAPVDGMKQTAVVAHVVASSPAVKAALETQSADLSHALRQTGLQLERLTVTVQAPGVGAQSGSTPGGDRSFSSGGGSDSRDAWQGAPSQTGNTTMGAGGSSSFASHSERQGGGAFQPSSSRASYTTADETDAEPLSVSNYSIRPSVGFDQRA